MAQLAQPQCFVDIYPVEGGSYSLKGSKVLACSVDKDIEAPMGHFRIAIPPGGPLGTSMSPYWEQIVTQMSLVVIGMRRGDKSNVVMVGVVRRTLSNQEWKSGGATERVTVIEGSDFGYYFSMFTYYSLWYLGATGANVGIFNGSDPGDSLPTVLGSGLLSGDPGEVGKKWFDTIMAGTSGVMAETFVQFQQAQVKFPAAMGAIFENYNVTIPYGDYFIATEGAWIDKFLKIFPFPFYEFFIATGADVTDFANVSSDTQISIETGTKFTSSGLDSSISGTPYVVARRNPLPQLTASRSGGDPSFDGIDTTAWDNLVVFQFTENFVVNGIGFDETEVANFFTINPTWMRSLFGQTNDSVVPWLLQYASAGDAASIRRYGFRPKSLNFPWMADPTGHIAANSNGSDTLGDVAGTLLARFAGYYEATPLMATAKATTMLRPDILIGSRFRYQPFKNGDDWDFYIKQVTHDFVFGGPSTTSLVLTRGLPAAVYSDTGAGGMLFNVYTGNAQRKDGEYVAGTPNNAPALQALSLSQFQGFLANIGKIYVTPQAT